MEVKGSLLAALARDGAESDGDTEGLFFGQRLKNTVRVTTDSQESHQTTETTIVLQSYASTCKTGFSPNSQVDELLAQCGESQVRNS